MPFDDLQRYKTVLGGILPVEKQRSCSLKYKNGAVIPETAPSGILPGAYRPLKIDVVIFYVFERLFEGC